MKVKTTDRVGFVGRTGLLASLAVSLLAASALAGEPLEATPVSRIACRTNDPTRDPGLFGDYWWANRFVSRHACVQAVQGQDVDVVMIGDSIIHFWEWKHPESWRAFTDGRRVLNLGYGGDKTETVVWRLQHGELDGYRARTVVLMIGTNNNSSDKSDPANVARGVEKIVELIRARQPDARIVLQAILPRGASATSRRHAAARARNDRTNALLKDYAARDGRLVWLDIGPAFLDETGWVPKSLMADEIHPTDRGYEIWMKALAPVLTPAQPGT